MTKISWGGKGLLCLHFHITVHHHKKSGQELKQAKSLKAGADAQAMEVCPCRLVPHDLLSLLSYGTPDYQSRNGLAHNGLGPPPSITN